MSITTFREQDLTGARFERVSLRGASFTQVFLNDANMHAVDFTGTQIRGALFNESRMRGVEVVDVEISGELQNVVVNGIDIAPLVDAELNRRMPERAKMRPEWDGIPWDREARPSLDAVLTVRRERQSVVRHVMESLTDEQLASEVTRTETGWPRAENFPFKECLRIVLNEEWEHRLYAERDLTALENEN